MRAPVTRRLCLAVATLVAAAGWSAEPGPAADRPAAVRTGSVAESVIVAGMAIVTGFHILRLHGSFGL